MITAAQKNRVIKTMLKIVEDERQNLIACNQKELKAFAGGDTAMYDRLKVDDAKVDEMKKSLQDVWEKPDPIGQLISTYDHPNGMMVQNKTAPFGTILIIYESRPDVTVEAAAIAFKSGNKILLKGGKESKESNLLLVGCWHRALLQSNLTPDWVQYLDFNRTKTQAFLKSPTWKLDLIVPRGGEGLIHFVKEHATCPVLVSGRGNNFLYVHRDADWDMAEKIILNAKLSKISACNALDKVLIDEALPSFTDRVVSLFQKMENSDVEVLSNIDTHKRAKATVWTSDDVLYEEFLEHKILVTASSNMLDAVTMINEYAGGHSATIVTDSAEVADEFMDSVDSAAVYCNASTRFTDGGQMGMGAELAISTDKLHHRGPLGLEQLVTNKWYIYGNGQIRE